MAQWELRFRVDVDNDEPTARLILKRVSKLDPRPISAVYDGGCVKMSFIIDGESQSEAHGQQARIHDRLSNLIDDTFDDDEKDDYAIEFDAPEQVKAKYRGGV